MIYLIVYFEHFPRVVKTIYRQAFRTQESAMKHAVENELSSWHIVQLELTD